MIRKQIVIKVLECILQSRVNVKKSQIRKFDEIHREIKQNSSKIFNGSLKMILDSLVYIETKGLRQKINPHDQIYEIGIMFNLVDNSTMKSICAELWTIEYDEYNQFYEQNIETQFIMTARLIEQLLFFLNQQPLFSEYYKNSTFKEKFDIKYELKVLKTDKQKENYRQKTITNNLNYQYIRERLSQSLYICINCSSLPRSDLIWQNNSPTALRSQKPEESTIDSKFKKKVQSPPKNRKLSLYEMYDDDLDFVFLSSSDEEFKKQAKNQTIKEITIQVEESEQFQLLFVNRDQEFVQQLRELFGELTAIEKKYNSEIYISMINE